MNSIFSRLVGVVLILAAVLGIALGVLGLRTIWILEPVAENTIIEIVDLLDRTLTVTGDLLLVSDSTLNDVDANIALLETSIDDMSQSIDSTATAAEDMAAMVGGNLSSVVGETQTALGSVQQSARLIDDMLRVLSAIPLVGNRYRSDVPLATSIAEVSDTLEGVPDDLAVLQENLGTTAQSFQELNDDVNKMKTSIASIKTNLQEARESVAAYQDIVTEMQGKVAVVRARIHGWVRAFVWGGTGLMIWLLFAQVGLLLQGLDLLRGIPRTVTVVDRVDVVTRKDKPELEG